MGITLLLTALPSENFQQVRSDPSLVRWLYERARLDDGVTLQGYYLRTEELSASATCLHWLTEWG